MSAKSPAFQFYAADFLADENVALMSLAGRGAYITLMCFCWREGSIPSEPERLAKLCGVDSSAMNSYMAELLPCFEAATGNPLRLVHPRLEKEREKQEEHRKERQEAGLRGAKLRWGKKIAKNGSAIAKPMAEPIANDSSSSSSSSPSSSSSSKEEDNSKPTLSASQTTLEIFNFWKTTLNHPKSVLDLKRRRLIEARLKEFSVDDLKAAITGCLASDWHMGRDPNNSKVFDGIDLIFRDAGKVEKFIGYASTVARSQNGNGNHSEAASKFSCSRCQDTHSISVFTNNQFSHYADCTACQLQEAA